MKIRNALIVLLAMFSLTGVSLAANQASYEAAMAEAQAANDKVAKLGFAWTKTEEAMKDAEAAAKAGDWEKAEAKAKEAKALADASHGQAESEKDAGPLF